MRRIRPTKTISASKGIRTPDDEVSALDLIMRKRVLSLKVSPALAGVVLLLLWISTTALAESAPAPVSGLFSLRSPTRGQQWSRPEQRKEMDSTYLIRGGSLETPQSPFVKAFQLVSNSTAACWTVLICSILCDGFAASLLKSARDTGSFARLLGALMVYIPW